MNQSAPPGSPIRWLIFVGTMLFSIFLITVGVGLMFLNLNTVPSPIIFGTSVLFLAASLWVLGPLPSRNWGASLIMLFIGLYGIGRATGFIQLPWMGKLVGLACWVAAGLLFYIARPGEPPKPSSQNPQMPDNGHLNQ